jgi:competence ComEA-like helix-hairpin-helix protein
MRPRFLLLAGAFLLLIVWPAFRPSQGADDPKPPSDVIPGIVFVGAPIFDEKTDGGDGVYQGSYHWRDGYIYPRSATYHRGERTQGPVRHGRNLYALIPARPDGKLTRLTHLKTGAVYRPEPSYDGKRVLFSMRRDGEDWFHLCEVNVDGTGLRQLTDGPFNDFAGVYLPDGRIVFCSDRCGYLEEYHEERTETLFTMNGDGRDMRQITFVPGTSFEPSVLRDGRILFSFWDAFHIDVPPFDKHETYLMTVNPDGTEERLLFGSGQYRFFNRERHSGVGLGQAREMSDGRILCHSEMGPSLIDLRAGLSVREALTPVFPGTTSVQLGGTTHRVHLSPLGTRSTPYPLQDGRFLFSATAPGARDSGIYVCDPDSRDEKLILDIPNYAEFDAVPVLVKRPKPAVLPTRAKRQAPKIDVNHATANELRQLPGVGSTLAQRIVDERGKGEFKSVEDLRRVAGLGPKALERLRPLVMIGPEKGRTTDGPPTTRFLVVSGRESDNPERAKALKRARYFRVIEAEYTGVTTSSHTNLETRILGMVPILPDGSAYFEAPADTPLFLDPIDAGGNRVLMEWSYPNTSVAKGLQYPATQMAYMVGRAGETKSCVGCHAPQTEAAPNVTLQALKLGPVKITRKSTDVAYRRNEPEAYRTQARIGDQEKWVAKLRSKDPVVRARACEMLMYLDEPLAFVELHSIARPADGGPCIWDYRCNRDALAAMVKLLKDKDVTVRRAAALALSRLATTQEAPALQKALKDSDWQVRFSAAAALEAIGKAEALKGEPLAAAGGVSSFEAVGRRLPEAEDNLARIPPSPMVRKKLHDELTKTKPDLLAIRAAGRLQDDGDIKLLIPWLRKHDWEYHAAEAAVALGRIGGKEARAALWDAIRTEVPNKKVHLNRYLQHGPRPEEYALLKGLILANADVKVDDVCLLIALLPGTFQEKPRFEDRLRAESQRVLMPRLLLQKTKPDKDGRNFRNRIVAILIEALRGKLLTDDPLYTQILKGINLERPFSEHGRPFNVVKKIGAEEALWLLGCLSEPTTDFPAGAKRKQLEELVAPFLTSKNHRERIDAAVLLGLVGFGEKTADLLATQIAKPYPFGEIASIGKGMPDENFRDKAYFVQALARHIDDVDRLKPFADPKKNTRDVRYGLTHGLAFRAKADGFPLLIEMATRDPITLIRQQARYALADIQDAHRLAEKPVPEVKLPAEQPLEALYPPRQLKWDDTKFTEFQRDCEQPPGDAAELRTYLDKRLKPRNFRNLNNAQATGAERMMVAQVEETRRAFAALAKQPGEVGRKPLLAALDSPYPYVHYLALRALAERGEQEVVPVLVKKLDAFIKAQDTVGFWWCCEALGRLKAKDALPALAKYAVGKNPSGTIGPEGMATGYIAAKALAQIAADPKHADVAKLLASDNIWLRAGTLRGLAEARAPSVEELLRKATDPDNPAVVRQEAAVQLQRLAPKE